MPLTSLGDGHWGAIQALTLWFLDHLEMLFGAPGASRGSRERAKALEEVTLHQISWFLSDIEAFQYLSKSVTSTDLPVPIGYQPCL